MKGNALLKPIKLGRYELPNRIFMSPMTRSRADNPDNAATPLIAEYYAQRASAGLIITEGSQVSSEAVGSINTPGIYSPAQIEGWKLVSQAVHSKNGHIFWPGPGPRGRPRRGTRAAGAPAKRSAGKDLHRDLPLSSSRASSRRLLLFR